MPPPAETRRRISPPPDPTLRLATGGLYNCFIDDERRVQCWGLFSSHSDHGPTVVREVRDAVEVVSGYDMACARTGAGEVWCWNEQGIEPVEVPPAVSIAVGQQYACAALEGGTVQCWSATLPSKAALGPTEVSYMEDAVEVAAGFYIACARSRGGEVRCWGEDHFGSVGADGELPVFNVGNTSGEHWATHILDDAAMETIDTDGFWSHTELLEKQAASCAEVLGVIEDELLVGVSLKVNVSGEVEEVLAMRDASGRPASEQHDVAAFQACAAEWYRRHARVVPTTKERTIELLLLVMPRTSALLMSHHVIDDAVALDSRGYFSCAVKKDHTVDCWGITHGFDGPGIHGMRLQASDGPVPVPGVSGFETISVGWRHICGRRTDGGFSCFGGNAGGEMGVEPYEAEFVVRDVAAPGKFADVTAGPTLGCGLTIAGEVLCWGNNDDTRLGIGSEDGGPHVPTPVVGLAKVAPITSPSED